MDTVEHRTPSLASFGLPIYSKVNPIQGISAQIVRPDAHLDFGHFIAYTKASTPAGWLLRRADPITRGTADLFVVVT